MAGDILYFLHRHFRVVFVIGAVISVMVLGAILRALLGLLIGS
jgi:hypothetical protein